MNVASLVQRQVQSLAPTASCQEAARKMRDTGVGSLVVSEADRPLGVLTDRDLVLRVLARGLDPAIVPVREAMSRMPIYVSHRREVSEVLELMREHAVRRVPVVDDDQALVGVVALDDVILALSAGLAAVADTIRKEM
jgi:CBS domain-containing protein